MNIDIETLKSLAIRGAVYDYIHITSEELGKVLSVSQQTASIRILRLLEAGHINRKIGPRYQKIKISKFGLTTLRKEFADYQKIFSPKENILINGTVSTGLGEGEYYVMQEGYKRQFKEKLGYMPYRGTLNLTVNEEEIEKILLAPKSSMIQIDGFKSGNRSFGKVTCLPAKLNDIECAIVIPKRSHHTNVIELLSKYQLRKTLGLNDGDIVELNIPL